MKNFKLLLIGLAVLTALVGCSKSSEDNPQPGPNPTPSTGSVVGDWHMISWSTLSAADVYISFSKEGTFQLYQRIYSPKFVHMNGTYTYDSSTLGGKYSDNVAWGRAYTVSFAAEGAQMTLTSTTNPEDVAVYVKATIPADIVSGVLQVNAMQKEIPEDMPRFL